MLQGIYTCSAFIIVYFGFLDWKAGRLTIEDLAMYITFTFMPVVNTISAIVFLSVAYYHWQIERSMKKNKEQL